MKKILVSFIIAILVLSLTSPIALAQPRKEKPLPATNVELVKKITLRGKPAGKGKPVKHAATGLLGEQFSGTNKYAIVIGISDYPGGLNDLEYADDDAAAMAMVLTNYGFGVVRTFIDDQATYENIYNSIMEINSLAGVDDEVVFYFSGHGSRGDAPDGDKEKVDEAIVCYDEYIWDGQLKDWFSDFITSRIIFIFDSCLAGGMTDLEAPGRIINMACSEKGSALEGSWGGGHGQFTYYYVVEGMQAGNADIYNHDGDTILQEPDDVTIEEAFDYAKDNCWRQTPVISDSFTNDLLP